MILVDTALQKRHDENNPVRVAVIGAGYMGRGVVLQILTAVPGMDVVAIYNRTISGAEEAYKQAGVDCIKVAKSVADIEDSIKNRKYIITDNAELLCNAEGIDVIVEVTGEVEFTANIVLKAIKNGKHIVLMNAEIDATIGPILKIYADKAGVIYTNVDGDQPGVIMNLYRYVKTIGCKPVLAGNMKGLQDFYRTPATQKEYAKKFKQKPQMVTSFADGTKISFEMAVVSNATRLKVGKRGMYGPKCNHVNEALSLFPMEQMLSHGLVDYILGAEPSPGVFVLGYNENLIQQQYLKYYKMGDGPLYTFYTPYHLCHLEVPITIARAVIFKDAVVAPIFEPIVDVITMAKKDINTGEKLDGIGGFTSYGLAENYENSKRENLLPMGLAEGCTLINDIKKDSVIHYSDIVTPENRLCDQLRDEQNRYFS